MAASNGIGGGGASVIQEQVNTGNPNLDKQINKAYSYISKTQVDCRHGPVDKAAICKVRFGYD